MRVKFLMNKLLMGLLAQTMTDVAGNPEEERHADYYTQPWTQEAVCRYFYNKVTYHAFISKLNWTVNSLLSILCSCVAFDVVFSLFVSTGAAATC